jgi:hypothetical protein
MLIAKNHIYPFFKWVDELLIFIGERSRNPFDIIYFITTLGPLCVLLFTLGVIDKVFTLPIKLFVKWLNSPLTSKHSGLDSGIIFIYVATVTLTLMALCMPSFVWGLPVNVINYKKQKEPKRRDRGYTATVDEYDYNELNFVPTDIRVTYDDDEVNGATWEGDELYWSFSKPHMINGKLKQHKLYVSPLDHRDDVVDEILDDRERVRRNQMNRHRDLRAVTHVLWTATND